jgi:hypothetical protein
MKFLLLLILPLSINAQTGTKLECANVKNFEQVHFKNPVINVRICGYDSAGKKFEFIKKIPVTLDVNTGEIKWVKGGKQGSEHQSTIVEVTYKGFDKICHVQVGESWPYKPGLATYSFGAVVDRHKTKVYISKQILGSDNSD